MRPHHEDFVVWEHMTREIIRLFKTRIEVNPPDNIRLNNIQYFIVHYLANATTVVIQQDLANWTKRDKSSILRSIDSLEKIGLLKRSSADDDRRKNQLMLTEKGWRIAGEYRNIMYGVLEDIFTGISPEEIATLYGIMRKIIATAKTI
jgi:DNA-binding MarR family transcriptional regulator